MLRAIFLCSIIVTVTSLSLAQTQQPTSGPIPTDVAERMAAEQRQREALERQRQAIGNARLLAISEGKTLRESNLETDEKGRFVRYSPRLNANDIQAISVSKDELKKNAAFLKNSKTGIVRLQNADICNPNDLLVQANGGCPNNVTGKATGFSFRTRDYRQALLADIFFKGGKLSAAGAFTVGVFSDLGDVPIESVTPLTGGVKQLIDFQPAADQDEVERQHSILKAGINVDGFKYFTEINIQIGNTYVLRSVAYKGKLFKGTKPKQVNVLADDERRDITVVFKVTQMLSDGSVVLLWKELKRNDPPKVVLEARTAKPTAPKTRFSGGE